MPQRISKPAPLERSRTALARFIMLHLTLGFRAAIALTPKYHPWRSLAASTFDSLRDMTDTTLHPRSKSGVVIPKYIEPSAPKKRIALLVAAVYLIVAQAIPAMPAVVIYHGPKLYPLKALGVTEEPIIAPRLRVYMTTELPSEVKGEVGERKAPR